jgi:hypothetical protein
MSFKTPNTVGEMFILKIESKGYRLSLKTTKVFKNLGGLALDKFTFTKP